MYFTRDEILMRRDGEFPLTPDLEANLNDLLIKLSQFRSMYGKPLRVSSGYRPGHFNSDVGGAWNSPHKICQAVDFHDEDGSIKAWVMANQPVLIACDLWMEDASRTLTWIHLQSRPISSGNRIFKP